MFPGKLTGPWGPAVGSSFGKRLLDIGDDIVDMLDPVRAGGASSTLSGTPMHPALERLPVHAANPGSVGAVHTIKNPRQRQQTVGSAWRSCYATPGAEAPLSNSVTISLRPTGISCTSNCASKAR